jgi:diketogulonate reductase-like aldo/keto reductase
MISENTQKTHLKQNTDINRFDLKQDDIFEIYNIAKKHIEELNYGFANIEDEKNQIRNSLSEILNIVLNGL